MIKSNIISCLADTFIGILTETCEQTVSTDTVMMEIINSTLLGSFDFLFFHLYCSCNFSNLL